MKEQLISIETAKLAKEKGFDSRAIIDKLFHTGSNRCSQSLLQKWLREEHDLEVFVIPLHHFENDLLIKSYNVWFPHDGKVGGTKRSATSYKTYEEALNWGLYRTLVDLEV